ncbi:MAG TPA: hypothetical protein VMW24_12600 [Sedimentisphaerales bacterium]|nr:hypothetical protein [Sedimentisphaerales bacterium]
MKRILLLFAVFCAVLLCRTPPSAEGAMSYGLSHYVTERGYIGSGGNNDPLYNFINEVETSIEAFTLDSDTYITVPTLGYILLTPHDIEPGTTEGMIYADDSDNAPKYYNGSSWISLGSGTFTGGSITSDITMANGKYIRSSTTTAHVTGLQVYDTTGTWENAIVVTNGATAAVALGDAAATLSIASLGGINVTDSGAVTGVTTLAMGGALTGVTTLSISGAMTADTYILGNGAILANDTDTEISFTEGGEDLSLDFTNNGITLKSSTGVIALAFGDIDALSGINTIAMDAAPSSISLAADGEDDFTVSVTGAQDASLILASSGTAEDAMQITTTAGGINITNGGASGGEDMDLTSTNASIILTAGEAATDAINIDSSGGVDVDAVDDIALTVVSGEAGEDILLTQTGANNSSITLSAAGTGADAIGLQCTAGTLDVDADIAVINTTADLTLQVTSSEAGEDILITQVGANASSITLSAAGTAADTIGLQASAGGVDIDAAAAFDVAIGGGQVLIASKDDAASAIALTANVGTTETIVVTNTLGESESAITLTSTAGGIDLNAAAGKDINLTGGQVTLVSAHDTASAISLTANVGTSETIVVTNTLGIDEAAVSLIATAGGVNIDAAADKNITLDGGQILLSSAHNVASAIALVANTGISETIVVTNTKGTGTGAVTLTATAGGIDIDCAVLKDIDIDGGQILLEAQDDVASAISLITNNGTSETIVVTNTQGEGTGAITLTSTAGGVDINAKEMFTVDVSGGTVGTADITLTNSVGTDAAAIALLATVGGVDINAKEMLTLDVVDGTAGTADIIITNTPGTDASAIYLNAVAGGIKLHVPDEKSLVMGHIGDDTCITVSPSNTPASELISVVNNAGTETNAIAITATAGGITLAPSSGISMSDKPLTNVGDIACDDIVDDTSGDIMYMLKTVVKTIDVDDDASTDDFTFDDDPIDMTEQSVDLGEIIPAYAEIVSCQVRCFETVTSSAAMSIDIGTATGGAEILATADTDTANDINSTTAGDGPEVACAATAKHVWVNATPDANWSTLDAGRWSIMVTYIDYGAAYTQKSP